MKKSKLILSTIVNFKNLIDDLHLNLSKGEYFNGYDIETNPSESEYFVVVKSKDCIYDNSYSNGHFYIDYSFTFPLKLYVDEVDNETSNEFDVICDYVIKNKTNK